MSRVPLDDPDDPRHGTTNGYGNHGCRCDACRAANTEHQRAYMERVRAEGRILGTHPSKVAYTSGCRCDACRELQNRSSREHKRAKRALDRGEG